MTEIEELRARIEKLEQGRRWHQYLPDWQGMTNAMAPSSQAQTAALPKCTVCGLDHNAPAHTGKSW